MWVSLKKGIVCEIKHGGFVYHQDSRMIPGGLTDETTRLPFPGTTIVTFSDLQGVHFSRPHSDNFLSVGGESVIWHVL